MKALIALCLALALCAFSLCAAGEAASLTLMVYLTGSDLESKAGAASADLNEMIAHMPDSPALRVLVMASGAKSWTADVSPKETAIYALRPGGMDKAAAYPLMNMGEPDTLRTLLDYGFENCPADRYALILWDHGAGPMMGVCFDELFAGENGMDSLSLFELRQALQDSPFGREKLDFIGFDACLMASLETACAIAPYAKYMIASQETEPPEGWSYAFLSGIAQDNAPADAARRIINAYFDAAGDTLDTLTLSCVDLSAVEDAAQSVGSLFDALSKTMSAATYPRLSACRVDTKSAGCTSPYEYDLIDLCDLLEVYEAEGEADCADALAALDRAILYQRSTDEFFNGLSIYYPHYNKERYLTPWAQRYASMGMPGGYTGFLDAMSSIWLGESLTDWSAALTVESAATPGQTQIALQLTDEQAAHFASAELLIFERVLGSSYHLTYRTPDVTLGEDGMLRSVYRGESLYMTDASGEPVSPSVSYVLLGDTIAVSALLSKEYFRSEEDLIGVFLLFSRADDGRYVFTRAVESDGGPLSSSKAYVDLSQWHEISLINHSYAPVFDEAGQLLPVSEWSPEGVTGSRFLLSDFAPRAAFLNLRDADDRFAVFKVTDVQNNAVYSDFSPLPNPDAYVLDAQEYLLADNEYCRIAFTGAQLLTGLEPMLRLTLSCENKTGETLAVSAAHRAVDRRIVDPRTPAQYVFPGETGTLLIDFAADRLENACLTHCESVSMTLEGEFHSMETLFSEPVEIPLRADFSALCQPPAPLPAPLASAQYRDLTLEILTLETDGENNLTGLMHIVNTGEETMELETGSAYVNDVMLTGTLRSGEPLYELPAGHDAYTRYVIRSETVMPYDRPLLGTDMLGELGVTSVDALAFDMRPSLFGETERVTFTLAQPYDYASARSVPPESADWPVVYSAGGLTLSLMDSRTFPSRGDGNTHRSFYFCVENHTQSAIILSVPYGSTEIDGRTDCFASFMDEIPPMTTLYTDLRLTYESRTAPDRFARMQTGLRIEDDADRSQTLQLTVLASGEPQTLTHEDVLERLVYTVYPAGQLEANAEPAQP